MIPYDDLVAALSAWRARKGLPVSTIGAPPSTLSTLPAPPPPTPPPAPTFAPPSRPTPPRAAPAARAKPITVPPPLEPPDSLDIDDASMLEEESAYENEGADFAVGFGEAVHDPDGNESTAIGGAPERPSEGPTDPGGPRTNNRNDDW